MSPRVLGREKKAPAGGIKVREAKRVFIRVKIVDGIDSRMINIVRVSASGQDRMMVRGRLKALSLRLPASIDAILTVLLIGVTTLPFACRDATGASTSPLPAVSISFVFSCATGGTVFTAVDCLLGCFPGERAVAWAAEADGSGGLGDDRSPATPPMM